MTDLTQDIADVIGRHQRWTSWGNDADSGWYCGGCEKRFPAFDAHVAALILAHLRPVVTTVAELDALPLGSVIRSGQGGIWEKMDDIEGGWFETAGIQWHQSADISLPATVLYRPAD